MEPVATAFPAKAPLDLTVAQRCDLLERTSWAKDFTWHELEYLARFMSAYRVAPKTSRCQR